MIFVVPDLHGNHPLARKLLIEAGIIDGRGKRIPGPTCVQLGDLINAVAESRDADLRILELAPEWFDLVLVGNHEYPYFGGGGFGGFWRFPEIEARVRELEKTALWAPCLRAGQTLVTHAGVTPEWKYPRAEVAAHEIARAWRERRREQVFAAVGKTRGGWLATGGILWSDFSEERTRHFSQVHGHTPQRDGPAWRRDRDWFCVNLDVGGGKGANRLVGLWLEDDGKPGEVVEVSG